jgi:hypothetical protein
MQIKRRVEQNALPALPFYQFIYDILFLLNIYFIYIPHALAVYLIPFFSTAIPI